MSGKKAFTLVELLVVVAIISLLVSILIPSLGKAKDYAKKAVCASNLNAHGKALLVYVTANNASYPHFAPWPWMGPTPMMWSDNSFTHELDGWPKFYAVLETERKQGHRQTKWGNWWYGGSTYDIWQGAFCPAMDYAGIIEGAYKAGSFGWDGNFFNWVTYHRWAIGYQWSPFLRAATPMGRYPNRLKNVYDNDIWQWIGCGIRLPDGNAYWTQAARPEEVAQLGTVAEAWDSWDIASTPNIPWLSALQTRGGAITPGWHAGVFSVGGLAMVNSNRHKSCANILYADAHVAADAKKVVDPAALGLDASYNGLTATAWDNWDDTFGNLNHLLPRCEFAQ